MFVPALTFINSIMDNDFTAGGCQWCFVEIEDAVDSGVRADGGVNLGRTRDVQRYLCVWEEQVPSVAREIRISTAKYRDKMIFETTYGRFSWVQTMVAGRR